MKIPARIGPGGSAKQRGLISGELWPLGNWAAAAVRSCSIARFDQGFIIELLTRVSKALQAERNKRLKY